MTTLAFTNAHVLTDHGFESDLSVIVEDGHIVAVFPGAAPKGATSGRPARPVTWCRASSTRR